MCIGHRDKLRRQEYIDRSLQYLVMASGSADPKKLPKMEVWWPIGGEARKNIKVPSRAKLMHYDAIFRSLGKNKNG